MNLCGCQPLSLVSLGESRRALPASQFWCLLRLLPRMCLTRILRGTCQVLWLPGKVLWVILLLDMLYLSCVFDATPLPLPLNDNASELVNQSDASPASSSRSSLSSLASHLAAPSAALSPSSLSLSSSRSVDDNNKHHGNASWNDTGGGVDSASDLAANSSSEILNSHTGEGISSSNRQAVTPPTAGKARKEFPLALVVASATAAVSILLFFCLSYLWHTRQLDRRAQKLAIRLAAEVNSELKCSQCRPVATYRVGGSSRDSGSDSGGEEDSRVLRIPVTVLDELNSLNEEEEEEEEGEDGSRRKPGGVGRTLGTKKGGGGGRGRGSRRSSSRSSRKWSGHSCGQQTRSSLVTDQEILTHFASRRHSTFFI